MLSRSRGTRDPAVGVLRDADDANDRARPRQDGVQQIPPSLSRASRAQNSILLKGDIAKAVSSLKQEEGRDLRVIGSTQLVQTLIGHDLVDELRLMIDPLLWAGEAGLSGGWSLEVAAARRQPGGDDRCHPGHLCA
jgi:riboflavin biosynthesis pyrimidine reductase